MPERGDKNQQKGDVMETNLFSERYIGLMKIAIDKDGRNYFDASPGSEDDAQWAKLVEQGFALLLRKSSSTNPDNRYSVRVAGKDLIKMWDGRK